MTRPREAKLFTRFESKRGSHANGWRPRASHARSRSYLPGVGLEIGNANVAEGDAAGGLAGPGEDVDVGDGETVGVGEGVGVGGGGIILSQRCSWTVAPPISSINF